MTIYATDGSLGTLMAQLEAELHERRYENMVAEQYETMGQQASADGKRNVAVLRKQNLVRTEGADPRTAATMVGLDTSATGIWLPSDDDKIF